MLTTYVRDVIFINSVDNAFSVYYVLIQRTIMCKNSITHDALYTLYTLNTLNTFNALFTLFTLFTLFALFALISLLTSLLFLVLLELKCL